MRLFPALLCLAGCVGEIEGVSSSDAAERVAEDARADADASGPDGGSIIDAASRADSGLALPDASAPRPDAAAPPRCGDGVCTETCTDCAADCGACGWPEELARSEEAVLVRVNQIRASGTTCGGVAMRAVAPLAMSAELREAARLHSADMGAQNYFDHASLDGRTFSQRAIAAGYRGSPVGENIAAGNATAEAAFDQWHRSPGHCRNMMGSSANEIGIGHSYDARGQYGHYWTQVFGAR